MSLLGLTPLLGSSWKSFNFSSRLWVSVGSTAGRIKVGTFKG